ncbi:hypothetical protein Nmel_008786 [Mimus melanotis]
MLTLMHPDSSLPHLHSSEQHQECQLPLSS